MFPLLADIGAADVAPICSTVINLGFSIWFAVRTVTKTIPDLMAAHAVERKETAERHREERREMSESLVKFINECRADSKSEREAFERWRGVKT